MDNPALPLALIIISILATGSAARPCKTLFLFSATTTTTYYPFNSLKSPNSIFLFQNSRPRFFTLIVRSTSAGQFPERSVINPDLHTEFDEDAQLSSMAKASEFPLKFYSSISSSIRDRSRDIMSVVGALLFGVGCGALTAVVMYFLWALFSPGRFDFDELSSSSDDDDDDGVAATKKKLGYIIIPSQPNVVDDDLKKTAPAVETVCVTNGDVRYKFSGRLPAKSRVK